MDINMARNMKVSEWFAKEIKQCDISHVFFIEAILRKTIIELSHHGVKPVLTHSEAAAAYMADGYSRIARKPGICMAQSVGASNLAAALQDAWLGKSQVLAITGCKPRTLQGRNAYQEVDHAKAFSATSKLSLHAQHPQEIPRVFAQAWRALHTGKMQPVHIDVEGLMGEYIDAGAVATSKRATLSPIRFEKQIPCSQRISQCVDQLLASSKVAIIAGYEAAYANLGAKLIALAEKLNAPIATTVGAKGAIATSHPMNIGVIGSYGMPVTNQIIHDADTLLIVGSQLSDQNTHGWTIVHDEQRIIQLDRNLDDIGKSYADTLSIVGDLESSIDALNDAIDVCGVLRDNAFVDMAGRRMADWRASVYDVANSNKNPIRVERIIQEINKVLPPDGVLVADTGYAAIWTSVFASFDGARQEYLRAAGSLGWAFPAAIGAKCAAGSRKVICFTGDGGFYYHMSEIEPALRNDIPLVVVVNNNSGFGQDTVNMYAQGMSKEDVQLLAGFEKTSIASIAQAFGANGMRVTRPEDIGPALVAALNSDTLTVVEVITQIDCAAPAAWKPEHN